MLAHHRRHTVGHHGAGSPAGIVDGGTLTAGSIGGSAGDALGDSGRWRRSTRHHEDGGNRSAPATCRTAWTLACGAAGHALAPGIDRVTPESVALPAPRKPASKAVPDQFRQSGAAPSQTTARSPGKPASIQGLRLLPPLTLARRGRSRYKCETARGRSSEVERQLPKLNVGGSIPPARSTLPPPPIARHDGGILPWRAPRDRPHVIRAARPSRRSVLAARRPGCSRPVARVEGGRPCNRGDSSGPRRSPPVERSSRRTRRGRAGPGSPRGVE